MPDANGRFKGISVPRLPWADQELEDRLEAERQLRSQLETLEYDDATCRPEEA